MIDLYVSSRMVEQGSKAMARATAAARRGYPGPG
jgi:hypothetical protein